MKSVSRSDSGATWPRERQQASGEGVVSELVIPVLTAQLLVLIYLQKFSINISEDYQVSIPLIFAFASLAWLGFRQAIRFEPIRFILYCIVVASAALSQSLGTLRISYSSIVLLILLYATFTLNWRVSTDQLMRFADRFSIFMIVPAILVLVQFGYELYFGAGNSLSLENYVPRSILLGGYVYESSTESWVTWNRPNGLVFLEPSFCSAFLACAAIMWMITQSPFGKTLQAIRDNQTRAEFIGIRVRLCRWIAFLISGTFTGLAGVLWLPLNRHVTPDVLYWPFSGEIVFLTVLGGFQSFSGPIVGAIAFSYLKTYAVAWTEYWQLLLGVVLIVLVIVLPTGIVGSAKLLWSGLPWRYCKRKI